MWLASPAVIGGRGLKLRELKRLVAAVDASPAVIGGRGLKPPVPPVSVIVRRIARRHRRAWVETAWTRPHAEAGTGASPAVIGGRGLKQVPDDDDAYRLAGIARRHRRAWVETPIGK